MSLYEQLLAKGKEAIADMERPYKLKKERKELEMKIILTEQQIAKDDLTIQEQMSASPISWDKLLNAIDAKELNERKLKQLQSLEDKLFSDNMSKKDKV